MARGAFRILDLLVPKTRNLWVFALRGSELWGGNLRAVCEAAAASGKINAAILNCSEPVRNEDMERTCGPGVNVVDGRSWGGFWAALRCRAAFLTHCMRDLPWPVVARKRLMVNLFHGVPLKRIELLQPGHGPRRLRRMRREIKRQSAIIASSHVDRLGMMACFELPFRKVWLSGLPRNDWLVCDERRLPADLHAMLSDLKGIKGDRKLIVYAPTFRSNRSGIFRFERDQLDDLASLLRRKNAVLGLRLHVKYRDSDSAGRIFQGPEFVDLGPGAFPETQIVIRAADILLTDYSSIWVDYLLLDRPVIGFVYDWEDYLQERGFLYDYRRIFPGPMVHSYEELKAALSDALDTGPSAEGKNKRRFALDLFHLYRDDQAARRVVEAVTENT